MTTNGIGLDRLAAPLAAAGLDRVNVSLDTIDPEHFSGLTRRDRFNDVVAGLKAASDAGLTPVKVNAVAMRGVNDADVPDLLGGASTAATTCASSSRCRSTPSTRGTARRWCRRPRSSSGSGSASA